MRKIVGIYILSFLMCAACSTVEKTETPAVNQPQPQAGAAVAGNANVKTGPEPAKNAAIAEKEKIAEAIPATKAECVKVDAGDNAILAAQTFPLDFAPFGNSCFVTSYNPEYDDPPMETEYAIYKNGRKVFDFPDKFNGTEFGCTVAGVAFEDLNGDNLTDVIVAGKCAAKSSSYNENMVYFNNGREFETYRYANSKLQNLNKIKEITDFVKKPPFHIN